VANLAKVEPFAVVRLLAKAIKEFFDLKHANPAEALAESKGDDYSTIWCRRVDAPSDAYVDPDEALIHALTNAGGALCDLDDPDAAGSLDRFLRDQPWKIFSRVRHHLYGRYPRLFREQVRDLILNYPAYAEDAYEREVAEVIRGASEQLGEGLLDANEMEDVGAQILSGPDREAFAKFLGEQFTEDIYQMRRDYLHRQQLWPFEPRLRGTLLARYVEVLGKVAEPPSIDTYDPRPMEEAKTGGHRSPVNSEQLEAMPDDQLLAYLNQWNDRKLDPAEWWIEIDHNGLADAFKACIQRNLGRFFAWGDRWSDIRRPIYLQTVLEVAATLVRERNFSFLPEMFAICGLVLAKRNPAGIERRLLSPASEAHPYWNGARRGMLDLIGTFLDTSVGFPEGHANALSAILRTLCLQDDVGNDQEEAFAGRHLDLLVDFARWAHHFGAASPVRARALEEVEGVLRERFEGRPRLTEAEYGHLAVDFATLAHLDEPWAKAMVPKFFRREEPPLWAAAFRNLVMRQLAYGQVYGLLADEFQYALKHLDLIRQPDEPHLRGDSTIAVLGSRLFTYYLWGKFPLNGDESLLEAFYRETSPLEWTAVMRHSGASIHRTVDLQEEVKLRATAFVDQRLSVAEASSVADRAREFEALANWISTKSLDGHWRLKTLHRALKIGKFIGAAMSLTQAIRELLDLDRALAVECFALITKWAETPNFYVTTEDAKAILSAGDASEDETVRELAREAREDLLRSSRFEYQRS
jgi:hypothetical protein